MRSLVFLASAGLALGWLACGTGSEPAPPVVVDAAAPDAEDLPDRAEPAPPDGAGDVAPRLDAQPLDARADATAVGCGNRVAKTGLLAAQPVSAAGKSRTYAINLPSTYDGVAVYPVVFVFHGVGQDPFVVRNAFQFEKEHEAAAIFVYPNALALWDILTYETAANVDVAFFDAMIADLERRYCVDKTRVFATGVSRGGYFANHLGCHRSNVIKAVASHAGGGPLDPSGTHFNGLGNVICPGRRLPALVAVGEADAVALSDAELTRRFYRDSNGCTTATNATTPSPCVALRGCAQPVTYCRVPGVAHELWSSGAKATWDFFGIR